MKTFIEFLKRHSLIMMGLTLGENGWVPIRIHMTMLLWTNRSDWYRAKLNCQ